MNVLRALAVTLVVATAVVFFEWLFFVTKPSFMSLLSPWEKIGVVGSTAFIVSAALLALTLPFVVVSTVLARLGPRPAIVSVVATLPPVLLLAMAMLVLADNFSQTLFGWGVRDASGIAIHVYRVAMLGLLVVAARVAHGLMVGKGGGALKVLTVASLLVIATGLPRLVQGVFEQSARAEITAGIRSDLPNIVVLTGDGVSAGHMSVYGYERPTTPFLDSVRDEFLVAENHFTNAADTGGSIIATLTGKLPTTTRVIYPPDVLRQRHSLEHLPAILRRLGYYNGDISIRHYADPYDLNLRDGYAEANFRRLESSGGALAAAVRRLPSLNAASQLIDRMSERITHRYDHIWKGEPMYEPLSAVGAPDQRWIRDDERMAEIRRFLTSARQPFFLTVHLMGPHGPLFQPTSRLFSTEADDTEEWNIDGYDDAIVDFDDRVRQTYEALDGLGLLDRTVLLISSDHGFHHDPLARLPLLMRLPNTERTGTIGGNTQRIDVAPTLLEILGQAVPEWMEGRSMLSPPPPGAPERPIFASNSRVEKKADGNFWSVTVRDPPWYSMGRINLVWCDQGFLVRLHDMELESTLISGSSRDCPERLTDEEARAMMMEHLRSKGYDTE